MFESAKNKFWSAFNPSHKSFIWIRRFRFVAGLLTRIESYSPVAKALQSITEASLYDPALRSPLRHGFAKMAPDALKRHPRLARMAIQRLAKYEHLYLRKTDGRLGSGQAAQEGLADYYAKKQAEQDGTPDEGFVTGTEE
jgi:hypothetical protein